MRGMLMPIAKVEKLLHIRCDDTFGEVRSRMDAFEEIVKKLTYTGAPLYPEISIEEAENRIASLRDLSRQRGDVITETQCDELLERSDRREDLRGSSA